MRMQAVAVTLAVLGLGLLLPGAARAQEEKVRVQAEVVLASKKGTEVNPPELAKMKEEFQKQMNYTSFKRMSLQVLEVTSKKSTELKLPNGTNVSMQLQGIKDGTATVRVSIPRRATLDVELGREGSVYQIVGSHVGGDLILVMSPPGK